MLAQVKKLAGNDLTGRLGAWWDGRDYVAPPPAEEGAEGAKAEEPAKPSKAEAKPKQMPAKNEPQPELKSEPKPEPATEAMAAEPVPEPLLPELNTASIRIKALETIWGEGRLAPGSATLDTMMLDAVLEHADKLGGIGFIGPDAALLNAFASRSERSKAW
jgi:hypothetical protein